MEYSDSASQSKSNQNKSVLEFCQIENANIHILKFHKILNFPSFIGTWNHFLKYMKSIEVKVNTG